MPSVVMLEKYANVAIHVDFVVGSSELSVYGVFDDGSEETIISKGEWGFLV